MPAYALSIFNLPGSHTGLQVTFVSRSHEGKCVMGHNDTVFWKMYWLQIYKCDRPVWGLFRVVQSDAVLIWSQQVSLFCLWNTLKQRVIVETVVSTWFTTLWSFSFNIMKSEWVFDNRVCRWGAEGGGGTEPRESWDTWWPGGWSCPSVWYLQHVFDEWLPRLQIIYVKM